MFYKQELPQWKSLSGSRLTKCGINPSLIFVRFVTFVVFVLKTDRPIGSAGCFNTKGGHGNNVGDTISIPIPIAIPISMTRNS